jgi:3-dehydroquinate dehydratase-2
MTTRILLLHGPNLNLLGRREPELYGGKTLDRINASLAEQAAARGCELEILQSNDEGALVTRIQEAAEDGTAGILLNPAAYTHTSVAIRDALLAVGLPAVEVHLTNPAAREEFRQKSLIADVVVGRVAGFGARSYEFGLAGLLDLLE